MIFNVKGACLLPLTSSPGCTAARHRYSSSLNPGLIKWHSSRRQSEKKNIWHGDGTKLVRDGEERLRRGGDGEEESLGGSVGEKKLKWEQEM